MDVEVLCAAYVKTDIMVGKSININCNVCEMDVSQYVSIFERKG